MRKIIRMLIRRRLTTRAHLTPATLTGDWAARWNDRVVRDLTQEHP